MINWVDPDKAPKDGTMILAVFRTHRCAVPAVWTGADGKWCVAIPNVEKYQGEYLDWYFENEYFEDSDLKVWAEIPSENAESGGEKCTKKCKRMTNGLKP